MITVFPKFFILYERVVYDSIDEPSRWKMRILRPIPSIPFGICRKLCLYTILEYYVLARPSVNRYQLDCVISQNRAEIFFFFTYSLSMVTKTNFYAVSNSKDKKTHTKLLSKNCLCQFLKKCFLVTFSHFHLQIWNYLEFA